MSSFSLSGTRLARGLMIVAAVGLSNCAPEPKAESLNETSDLPAPARAAQSLLARPAAAPNRVRSFKSDPANFSPVRARHVAPTVVALGLPPANDSCTAAIVVPSSCDFTDVQDTTGATDDLGEPESTCTTQSGSVWYSYTNSSAFSVVVVVDTCASDFDTALMVFEADGAACDVSTPVSVACNDDSCGDGFQSRVQFVAAAGKTYKIQAGGFDGETGTLTFHQTCTDLTCADTIIHGTLGSGSLDHASVSGTQTGRLNRNGIASTCLVPKTCNVFTAVGQRAFDAYTVPNLSGQAVCVNVDIAMVTQTGANYQVNAYLDSYDPTAICANYLADPGLSSGGGPQSPTPMSFMVPAAHSLVLVAHTTNPGEIGGQYVLSILGNICATITCGDGVTNTVAGEACDTGGPSATCNTNCTLSRCGDGIVNIFANEACDPVVPNAKCNADCTLHVDPSTTTLTSSRNPTLAGEITLLTATVTPPGATGLVVFKDGTVELQTVPVSQGVAELAVTFAVLGSHPLSASYGGDLVRLSSVSAVLDQMVGQSASTTTLMSSDNPSTVGGAVTLTAVVSPAAATGTVTFRDGAVVLGTQTLTAGLAALTVATLSAGTHAITATYGGEVNYLGSTSPAVSQAVAPTPLMTTTTVVTGAPNPSTFDSVVWLTATTSPSAAMGTVTFTEAAVVLGTVSLIGGTATLTIASLHGGVHTIVATYGGDTTFAGSSSMARQQTVTPADTATVLLASPNPAGFGQSVTFTGVVTSAATGTPTGTLTGSIDGTAAGTVPLVDGVATFTASALVAGTHTVTVTYSGDADFGPGSSPTLAQVVKQATASAPDAGTVPDAKLPVDAMTGAAADGGATADGSTADGPPAATPDGGSTVDPIVPKPIAGGGCSCQTSGPVSGNWMWLFGFTLVLAHRTRAARRRSARAGRPSVA